MSPRRLDGWEPAEVTRYEYDDDGRLVSSVTTREPEWCRADVEALVAFMEMRRDIGPHGQPMSEATSPDADPSRRDRKFKYEVEPVMDFAEKARGQGIEAYKRKYGEIPLGMKFVLRKVNL